MYSSSFYYLIQIRLKVSNELHCLCLGILQHSIHKTYDVSFLTGYNDSILTRFEQTLEEFSKFSVRFSSMNSPQRFLLIYADISGFQLDFSGLQGISLDSTGFQWISADFSRFQWISLDFSGFSRISGGFVLNRTRFLGVICPLSR